MNYTVEDYKKFANEFSLKHFGKPCDINIRINNRLRSVAGSFVRMYGIAYFKEDYEKRKRERRPITMYIELKTNGETHESIIDTLKHELCHWYCYTEDLEFEDGTVDFERMLQKVGASSTLTNGELDKSYFIQILTQKDMMIHGGITKATYQFAPFFIDDVEKLDCIPYGLLETIKYNRPDFKAYKVYVNDVYLGYVFSAKRGQWFMASDDLKTDIIPWRTRKECVGSLLVNQLVEKQITLDELLVDFSKSC